MVTFPPVESALKILFASCTECDDGSTYSLTARYSAEQKKWVYPEGIVTEIHSEEVESE